MIFIIMIITEETSSLLALFPEINECLTESCFNGGTCVDRVNGVTCLCTAGYEGLNCEIG